MPYSDPLIKKIKGKLARQQKRLQLKAFARSCTTIHLQEGIPNGVVGQNVGTVLIKDDEVILQRLSLMTTQKITAFNKLALAGKQLLDKLNSGGKPINAGCSRPRGAAANTKSQGTAKPLADSRGHVWHLGIWRQMGRAGWTAEHLKNKETANEITAWVRQVFREHVAHRSKAISPEFMASLAARQNGFDSLIRELGSDGTSALHPWYSMIALFEGDTKNAHLDRNDAVPSFLINFGSTSILRIATKKEGPYVALKLHIGDVVLFNSQKCYHLTDSSGQGRWSVGLFVRNVIANDREYKDKEIRATLGTEIELDSKPWRKSCLDG